MAGRSDADRRRRAAWLSLIALVVTGTIWVLSLGVHRGEYRGWLLWMLSIGLPPIVMSGAAAAQYRWGRGTGAGAAAAVVYWVLLLLLFFRAGPLYLIGGILQTVAWYVGRPVFSDAEELSTR